MKCTFSYIVAHSRWLSYWIKKYKICNACFVMRQFSQILYNAFRHWTIGAAFKASASTPVLILPCCSVRFIKYLHVQSSIFLYLYSMYLYSMYLFCPMQYRIFYSPPTKLNQDNQWQVASTTWYSYNITYATLEWRG